MNISDEKGAVLVMVMVYALVLSVLGIALMTVAMDEYRMNRAYRCRVAAHYLAEAGMEKALADIAGMDGECIEGLRGAGWSLQREDSDLVMGGVRCGFKVTVDSIDIFSTEGMEEDGPTGLYQVILRSVAEVGGMEREIEAKAVIRGSVELGDGNRMEIQYWRQIR